MRVYGWAITENRVKQGKEIDRTTLDALNDNDAIIDDDASSFNTMNGWNALEDLLSRGLNGEDNWVGKQHQPQTDLKFSKRDRLHCHHAIRIDGVVQRIVY
jgi:hypothetical protein